MYDTNKVIIGLALFAVVFGYPFYNNILSGSYQEPALAKAKGDVCVEDPEWMRANHMDLLNEWRHAVSREGLRIYTSTSGKQYVASLQRTCMDCHGSFEKFCNECHLDNSVNVYCWTCHITPEAAGGGMPGASTVEPNKHAEPEAHAADAGHGGHGKKPGYLGFKEPHAERMTAPTHDGVMRGGEMATDAEDHNDDHGKEHDHE